MFITPANAIHYLIQRGLLDYPSLTKKQICISAVDKLRAVIEVINADSSGWILKQPNTASRPAVGSLQLEATFYHIANKFPPIEFSRYLPSMVEYDGNTHVLILERVGSANAWFHLLRSSQPMEDVAPPIATAFQALHQAHYSHDQLRPAIRERKPWILTIAESSDGTDEDLSFIRNDHLILHSLCDLAREWSGQNIIHGDAKLENVMLNVSASRAWLIDWSQVGFGDPAWDIAGIVQSALALWTMGLNLDPEKDFSAALKKEAFSYEEISLFIRSFLNAYGNVHDEFLTKVFKMSGARMLQTVFEGTERNQVRNHYHLAMLRLAKSALTDPESLRREYAE
ncbi:MAG: phosphotransferase family protein [Cyanobacteriota bacterium]